MTQNIYIQMTKGYCFEIAEYPKDTDESYYIEIRKYPKIFWVCMSIVTTFIIIWATSWENLFYAIYEQQRRRSACASAQSDQHFCFSLLR